MEQNMEKFANTKMTSEMLERNEPTADVLKRMLDDMEFLGLIEFKPDAAGGGCWVVREQNPQTEPIKQDNDRKAA
jgi:hypothetical protein